jgi:cardiolipin synthase
LHSRFRVVRDAGKVILVVAVTVALVVSIAADPSTVRLESTTAADAAGFAEYMALVTASPVTAGDRYVQLVNGDAMFPAMIDAIRAARERVSLFTYIYEPGRAADLFGAAFQEAARRGVAVTIVVDAFGASNLDAAYERALEDAGCIVEQFRPFRWYSIQESNYRNHRKLLVVDGRVAFIGGAGIADHWLGNAEDRDHWRDTQFRIEGPIVGYLEAAFYDALAETHRTWKPAMRPEAAPATTAGGGTTATRSVVVSSSPGSGGGVKRLMLMSIAAARRSNDITSPYFIGDASSGWALREARRRGVRIRVLVEGDRTDAKPVKWASRADYESLLGDGIEIYEYQPTMMHAKTVVVDGAWSVIGSANFDNRSLDMNDELSVGVQDPSLAAALTAAFESDLARSRRLALDAWRNRPLLERANEHAWSVFAELF